MRTALLLVGLCLALFAGFFAIALGLDSLFGQRPVGTVAFPPAVLAIVLGVLWLVAMRLSSRRSRVAR